MELVFGHQSKTDIKNVNAVATVGLSPGRELAVVSLLFNSALEGVMKEYHIPRCTVWQLDQVFTGDQRPHGQLTTETP